MAAANGYNADEYADEIDFSDIEYKSVQELCTQAELIQVLSDMQCTSRTRKLAPPFCVWPSPEFLADWRAPWLSTAARW